MKNVLLDKGIILPSGEISKDKVNLVTGAITQPFAEMVWVTTGGDMETVNRLTDVLVTMNTPADRGKLFKIIKMLYYLVDELEEPELPEEAKKYFMYEEYGRDASINDGGMFTEQGYIYNNRNTFTEWYDGRDVPEEYRITPQPPQPERPDPSKVEMDAAAPGVKTVQATEQPQEPRPVIPIVLTSEKPAEKLKEITDRLEQGIAELFDSERYKEYLRVMSKFHNYSFNNTLLIAMQKPDASLVAGFSAWKNNFGRNVMKGQKGIKIIAPSPFKIKQEMEKIDPHKKRCTECGAFFASKSNSVKYCPDCRKRITRRQAAERMRKKRTLVTQ